MDEVDSTQSAKRADDVPTMSEELGRLPVGHGAFQLGLVMPKPDESEMGNTSMRRFVGLSFLVVAIVAAIFLVLTGLR
jgi:hypothetical protein